MAEPLPQQILTSQESQGDYLSVAQVAQRLGCSVSLVQKWRRLGWLPATRLGPPDVPVYGYHPADVERFARERWNRRRGRPPKVREVEAGPAETAAQPRAGTPGVEGTASAPRSAPSAITAPRVPRPAATSVHVHAPAPPAPGGAASSPMPAGGSRTAQPVAPEPPAPAVAADAEPASARPTFVPAAPTAVASVNSGRPLALWDGDPTEGTALILARFPAGQVDEALRVAAVWARRYGSLALGEVPLAGEVPHVLARWQDGVQIGG